MVQSVETVSGFLSFLFYSLRTQLNIVQCSTDFLHTTMAGKRVESVERVSLGDCKQLRQFNGAAPEYAKNALAMA